MSNSKNPRAGFKGADYAAGGSGGGAGQITQAPPLPSASPSEVVWQELQIIYQGLNHLTLIMQEKLDAVRVSREVKRSDTVSEIPCEMPRLFLAQFEHCQVLKSQLHDLLDYMDNVKV